MLILEISTHSSVPIYEQIVDGVQRLIRSGCWLQPKFGVQQPDPCGLRIATIQKRPGIANSEHGPGADYFVGQYLQPAKPRD